MKTDVDTAQPTAEPALQAVDPGQPTVPLTSSQVAWYSLASLGCGMFFSFNNAAFTLYLEDYTKNVVLQGLMASSHSVEGAIIQPIVGTMSDRLRSPLGRRRPFMLLFIP